MFLQWIFFALASSAAVSSPIACERWFHASGAPKGVVVLTHGMNMQPACMDALATSLADEGWEVFRAAFAGHCPGRGDYLRVTSADWEADARRIHAEAKARSDALKVPLELVAYSFSSLVFQTMYKELPFAKRAYFAPPFATKFWYPLVRLIVSIFPELTLESRNPYCAANRKTNGHSVLALEDFLKRWREGAGHGDQAPLLAFADPEDELVSFDGLKEEIAREPNWRLEPVSNEAHTLPKTYHHLIIDGPSLGEAEWAWVRGLLKDFLAP